MTLGRRNVEVVVEEILAFLIEILFEFVLQLVIEGICYLVTNLSLGRNRSGIGLPLAFILIGGLLGAGSAWVYPRAILRWGWLRVANLLVTPVLIGWFATQRVAKPASDSDSQQFWNAFLFAFAFTAIRFAMITK